MKTITRILLGVIIFTSQLVTAQIELETVNISPRKTNVSKAVEARYCYFPNLQAYYDLKRGLYIYKQNGEWKRSRTIDSNYRGYSLNNILYVLINNYSGEEPYTLLDEHKLKYPANYSSRPQPKSLASSE